MDAIDFHMSVRIIFLLLFLPYMREFREKVKNCNEIQK